MHEFTRSNACIIEHTKHMPYRVHSRIFMRIILKNFTLKHHNIMFLNWYNVKFSPLSLNNEGIWRNNGCMVQYFPSKMNFAHAHAALCSTTDQTTLFTLSWTGTLLTDLCGIILIYIMFLRLDILLCLR